ncbi:MAG: class I SAM-dependent methyltransferase, partial [Clostridia bacterium]|nr:class I SAM-dependent methyltransferase [Deltaproteobacteria bacterium]
MTDITNWVTSAETRYLKDLTFQEARKSLQALSTIYVQRRDKLASGAALETKGKRAAFAFFYGPLHFLLVRHVVEALSAAEGTCAEIVDAGCGTGVAGAAWGSAFRKAPAIVGVDVDAWAVKEALWTYGFFNLAGSTQKASVDAVKWPDGGGLVAAYTVNELSDKARGRFIDQALRAKRCRTLVIEPIAKSPVPWWQEWSA